MNISIIAARAKNNVIGAGPDIPWQAKGEQKLFKDITLGGTLIMGRKTFESIGRPLPGRETIIITRSDNYSQQNCHVASSIEEALEIATTLGKPVFIAGGGEIYAQAISRATDIHLTTIDVAPEGDVFFPEFAIDAFELVAEEHFSTNLEYTYQHFRIRNQ